MMKYEHKTDIELVKQIVNDLKALRDKMYVEEDAITFKEEYSKSSLKEQGNIRFDVLDGRYYAGEIEKMFIRLYDTIKEESK